MAETKIRLYSLDGDTVQVCFEYDEEIGKYFGEYPNFDIEPRITPGGRAWVNVTKDNCPYADKIYGDCGSCKFFRSESPGDLIGICENENLIILRKEEKNENDEQ